ncbi:N-acetylglucosamine-6-phosphate deacetylase [Sedimentimonas flavescens]|uniref:N-acetylglucosamine-6-phosphate deacetylase n=1 Tax=Sedimentimonas flavescens TaxID=2851012 RepID=UPI0021A298BD|nr:N-acetylglucosamine-6-phosphate deacetylase [Sedimentimonas flavescens]MCT2538929.1 N-acetylglucosamine-6-phosphate deacetylase [Sedimentimonas flavescens]
MTQQTLTFLNGPIFDGLQLRTGLAARFEGGKLAALGPENVIGRAGKIVDLAGDILGPGYVDLQVNGGDGVMFNDDPSVSTLRRIAGAHRRLGVAALLPTLITDTREKTQAAIAAAIEAVREAVPGIAGLHLEGPHLSLARKGAHDPALIRPMDDEDLAMLLAAAAELPVLKITIAPENVTLEQVQTLARAGVLVSLGHSDANFDTCQAYFAAGARCVTHLFNAMSQLGNRNPGLVGATLANGAVSAGLIADGIHVHPQSLRAAWAAKTGPGRLFLVSDAMAVAGSDATQFTLEGRLIRREGGRLTLEDGTLAGADLDLTTAIRVLVNDVGVSLPEALRAATSAPAAIIGQTTQGQLAIGCKLDSVIRIDALLGTVAQAG